jgi:hypothetical protein
MTGTICAYLVIAFLDDFDETISQKTVVLLDNVTIYYADEYKNGNKKVFICFSYQHYSTHLNLIETLMRMIKYLWCKAKDCFDFSTLTDANENIISDIGKKFDN